jgi:hypothetical protein
VRSTVKPQDAPAREIGPELLGLIHAAQANSGIVVRPAPVLRLGLEGRPADVSAYASVLTDTHTLLRVLREVGVVDQLTEESARQYFAVQDKGWSAPAAPQPRQPLYLDSLSLSYLQTVGLLDAVAGSFVDVYIHADAEEDAFALIERDHDTAEIQRVIDHMRKAIRKAYVAGKIIFGPRWSQADESGYASNMSTPHLLGDLLGSDAVVFDDRALNKELFVTDRAGGRARILTSLDIIEEVHTRGLLSAAGAPKLPPPASRGRVLPDAVRRRRDQVRGGAQRPAPVTRVSRDTRQYRLSAHGGNPPVPRRNPLVHDDKFGGEDRARRNLERGE